MTLLRSVDRVQTNRKAKFRLERIRVKEVSVVDRPANLEPFLVVKRDSMGDETQTEETAKATPPAPPQLPATPAAQPAPPAPQPQQPGKLGPLSTATKDLVLDAAKSAIESLQGIAMAVGEAPTDDAAGVPPELAASFSAAIGKLQQLVQAVAAPPPPPQPPAPPPQPAPTAPAAKSDTAAPESVATPVDPGAIAEAVASGVAKAVASANAEMRASIDKLVTTLQVATAKGVVKSIPVGNGQRGEDGGDKKPTVIWPEDIAESAKKREDVR